MHRLAKTQKIRKKIFITRTIYAKTDSVEMARKYVINP